MILVIDRRRFECDGDLGGARIGPQAQIDAIGVTILGHVLQQCDQPLGEPHEEGRWLDGRRKLGGFGIEEDDEVDVARIIELARAMLAHGENDIAAVVAGAIRIGKRHAAEPCRIAQQPIDRRR